MTYIVLAAIDDSAATGPVLAATRTFADLFQVEPRALHVGVGDAEGPAALSREAGVPLQVLGGDPVRRIQEAFSAEEVVTGVIGTRGERSGHRPAGHTALAVIQASDTPVLVVPPTWRPTDGYQVRRILVPLDASHESSAAVRRSVSALRGSGVETVALHVFDPEHVPSFTDQPQHELSAWGNEFLARYSESDVRLELRRGHPGHNVVDCCRELGADVVVLGWSRDLSPGRAEVVRDALAEAAVPVLLLPVAPTARAAPTMISSYRQG